MGGENLPVFQVCDRSLGSDTEPADALVVDLVSGRTFLAGGLRLAVNMPEPA